MAIASVDGENQMTEAKVNFSSNNKSKFCNWAKELEQLAQAGLNQEIATHKANGRPIFYSKDGILIMELADGRCFEYRHLQDGTREIIREV